MPYCANCGAKNEEKHQYCIKCGTTLYKKGKIKQKDIQNEEISYEYKSRAVNEYSNLVRRNFLIWLLLSFAVSVFSFVYLYLNFMDLNELDKHTSNKEGPSIYTDLNKLIIDLVLSLFIPFYIFVVYHRKYKLLNEYLKFNQRKQKNIPISASKRIGLFIVSFIISLLSSACFALGPTLSSIFYSQLYIAIFIPIGIVLSIVCIVIIIYTYYYDYKWQEALNERILMINPYAEEKLLF